MVLIAVPGGFPRAPLLVRARPGIGIVGSIQRALGAPLPTPGSAPEWSSLPFDPGTLAADRWLVRAGPEEASDDGRPTNAPPGEANTPPEADMPTEAGEPRGRTRTPRIPSPRGQRRRLALEVDLQEEPEASRALRNAIDRLVGDIVERRDDDRS